MDKELLLRLIAQRLDGDIDEETFDSIRRGLARADQDDDEDEDVDGEIARLIVAALDEVEARTGRIEEALAALGLNPAIFARGDRAEPEPGLDPPVGGIIEPVEPDPGVSEAPRRRLVCA